MCHAQRKHISNFITTLGTPTAGLKHQTTCRALRWSDFCLCAIGIVTLLCLLPCGRPHSTISTDNKPHRAKLVACKNYPSSFLKPTCYCTITNHIVLDAVRYPAQRHRQRTVRQSRHRHVSTPKHGSSQHTRSNFRHIDLESVKPASLAVAKRHSQSSLCYLHAFYLARFLETYF